MLTFFAPLLLLAQGTLAAPVENTAVTRAAATVGKIRGVRDPIYHLYLQTSPKNGKRVSVLALYYFIATISHTCICWRYG